LDDEVKEDKTAGPEVLKRKKQNAYRHLMGKPERNIQLGRPSRRWNDNIKMDLEEIGR
jgi:hypothetical protein